MKIFATIIACVVATTPTVSSAGDDWAWALGGFLLGRAVENRSEHRVPVPTVPRKEYSSHREPIVLINGVWMQRTLRCYQEIVTDWRGDERVQNHCNYVYVPVDVVER